MENTRMFENFRGNIPANITEIEQVEAAVGFKLPSGYQDFLKRWNGGDGFVGPNSYVIFWRAGELAEMNKAYQVGEYAPGLFIFGSDGGGEAYAFDTRTSEMPIVSVPFVGMELSLSRVLSPTFSEFLSMLANM